MLGKSILTAVAAAGLAAALPAHTQITAAETTGTPEERAASMVVLMTLDEKLTLLKGYFGTDFPPARFEAPEEARARLRRLRARHPPARHPAAMAGRRRNRRRHPGRRGGKARPHRAALGPRHRRHMGPGAGLRRRGDDRLEARADGFNVPLGGSVNLIREPRNGRNFEHAGEDPLLAGVMVGAQIAGVQSNGIISTAKHYAVNAQETDRGTGNSVVEEAAMRMSDLLAFQFAVERGNPGAVMWHTTASTGRTRASTRFSSPRSCATSGTGLATSCRTGARCIPPPPRPTPGSTRNRPSACSKPTGSAPTSSRPRSAGEISEERIDLMAVRVLHAMVAHGLIDRPVSDAQPIDFAAHREVAARMPKPASCCSRTKATCCRSPPRHGA